MLDDDLHESPPTPPGRMSRRLAVVWMVLPLLVCAGCMAMTLLALLPGEQPLIPIPITGGEPRMPPTPLPDLFPPPMAEQDVPPGVPTLSPGLWYRAEMERRLEKCYASFNDVYMLEQIAFYQPMMLHNEDYRGEVVETVQIFRQACEQLGSLPQAPHSLREVDIWLKLAAAEVGPAADSFSALVENDEPGALQRTVNHLFNFVEYARNAESALERLNERKEI
jgi:hypothetical protein